MAKVTVTVEMKDLYDADEAAAALEKGVATVWRWIRDGKLSVVRIGGRTLVPQSEIDRARKSQGVELNEKNTQSPLC
jgi:excisionase family DNA binding protein